MVKALKETRPFFIHHWNSALVVNSHLIADPTIRRPVFDLPRRQWSPESFPHCARSLWCLPEEMATGRLWSVCLWRVTNNVLHHRFLSADKAGWWLVQAALCRWWCCCMADLLWWPIEDAQDNSRLLMEEALLPLCHISSAKNFSVLTSDNVITDICMFPSRRWHQVIRQVTWIICRLTTLTRCLKMKSYTPQQDIVQVNNSCVTVIW